ncbi:MAG: hypothetical protein KGZ97_03345 [Bacteroidetes bacterium]|nr:hypothetical protein [Bacteroidota bacterium]
MKTMKFFAIYIAICLFSLTTFGQYSLRNTVYITPGMNLPGYNFGYPKNINNASLNTLGAGFGVGMLFYFNNPEAEVGSIFNYGLDFTVAEFDVNSNVIVDPNSNNNNPEWFWYSPDPELSSRMVSMKIGPVITIVPQSKIGIDIYAQGMLALSSFDFYNNERDIIDSSPSMTPQYRAAAGFRLGYHVLFLNVEYSWGEPIVRKQSATSPSQITEFKVDQSFFRMGLTFKFSAFK